MTDHCFISYSAADGLDFATELADELQGRHPFIKVWFDKREMDASIVDWDDQLGNAIKGCKCLVFIMTPDSTAKGSTCKEEWTWALKYKKPVICLLKDKKAEVPFRLFNRQYIDISTNFDSGIAQLRSAIKRLDEPEGILEELDRRLSQAKRDLQRTPHEEEKPRIQSEIDELNKQIEAQQRIVADPEAAKKQTEQNIQNGLERERKPQLPVASFQSSKFINQPPGVAQTYFQDRLMETEQAILFLKNEAQRVLTVVGRGGAGKTAMVCRLLKFVENGGLPDDFERKHGRVEVDGIVYLSEAGSRKVNFANLFEDLCKLLPAASAEKLSALYREPQTSTESKTVQLLAAFQGLKQVIVLLDNFENVVDAEKGQVRDAELDEALRAILHAPHHPVKIIITTRVSARELDTFEPARQRLLPLDTGLQPEYAREAFVLMDEGNLVGIKNAGADLLNLAVMRTLGLPRALEALYAALRTDRFTTLQELLDLPILPEQVVQAYVGEAFNRLDTNAQKVMQALAVYNRPVTPAAVDYLLAPHIPAIDSAPILQRLANMHFARKESGRFYLHPVDREFAFGLLPEGNFDDRVRSGSGIELLRYFSEKILSKYPDLLQKLSEIKEEERQEIWQEIAKNENPDLIRDLVTALQNLDPTLQQKMQDPANFEDENYVATLDRSLQIPQVWTRYALMFRAADYFAQARKPRAEWKKLEDLSAQLAEFDLRCAAGDYDTAASVLTDFDFDYLFLWGHYRLIIDLHEKLQGKITDLTLARISIGKIGQALDAIGEVKSAILNFEKALAMATKAKSREAECTWLGNLGGAYYSLGDSKKAIEYMQKQLQVAEEISNKENQGGALCNLGNVYADLGDLHKAIENYEQALVIAREAGNHVDEGTSLGVLGSAYSDLGNPYKAIEYYEQSLVIAREIGDRRGEGIMLGNIAEERINLDEYELAIQSAMQYVKICEEISKPAIYAYRRLAEAYLYKTEFTNAKKSIEAALNYDEPQNNHNASALHGIIALRQGDEVAARGAFVRAIWQADEILSKTAEYYSALDAKGIALSGLVVSGEWEVDSERQKALDEAVETFRKARKIAPHAGVVKSVLRLFDELVKCDQEGILKDVRNAAEGKE